MRFARLGSTGHYVQLDGDVARVLDAAPWLGGTKTGESAPWRAEELACPVVPSKIVCVGRNYAAHAKELGHDVPKEPLLFLKPPSALVGPGGVVRLPGVSERVEHEAELAVVIGERARCVNAADAMGVVFGYSCACDVTARDLQKKDGQWARAKGFDTFCPIGPWIETKLDPRAQLVRCRVGGHVRQDGAAANMIFDVATLVAYVSAIMTLEPGDVILTGTPEGVGPLAPGDDVEVEVSEVGVLRFRVRRVEG
jgi:2-keto-4-pentenoate hydratase/2-oxohepta-3-ene-1,7-dioic acid hydratase in catechol pathway